MPNAILQSAQSVQGPKRRLRDLAGVGKSICADLESLGVQSVADLAERDGDDLYAALCEKSGQRQDPCVLDTFRCAVAQARDPELPRDQRNWWWWSAQRLQQQQEAKQVR